jgi:hypothetical protein
MASHGQLPDSDPFAYTPAGPVGRTSFFLRSYWVVQLAYHYLYSAGGTPALVVFRFAVLILLALALLRNSRRWDPAAIAFAGAGIVTILTTFPADRPQVVSFVFFALLLGELSPWVDGGREKPDLVWSAVRVSALMAIWSNCHGAHVLGQATLFLFAATGLAVAVMTRSLSDVRFRGLVLVAGAGLVASGMNPNGWSGARYALGASEYNRMANMEYASTWLFFRLFGGSGILVFWALLACAAAAFVASRRRPLAEIVLVTGLAGAALLTMRYIPFFVVAAVPFILAAIPVPSATGRAVRSALAVGSLATIAVLTWPERGNVRNLGGTWIDETQFPVRSASFVATLPRSGNLYNHFDFGGYLIWRLAPERKVFVDGRTLNDKICLLSAAMAAGERVGRPPVPLWEIVFAQWNIDVVVTAPRWPSGEPLPLAQELLRTRGWRLAFADSASWVFLRQRTGANPESVPLGTGLPIPEGPESER